MRETTGLNTRHEVADIATHLPPEEHTLRATLDWARIGTTGPLQSALELERRPVVLHPDHPEKPF